MAPHLVLSSVSKSYGNTQALRSVDLSAYRGEAMALMGANGAGKSTLMNVLGGVVRADGGAISIDGRSVTIGSPMEAAQQGIAFVQQELNVLPSMTVAENIMISRLPTRFGLIDVARVRQRVDELLRLLGCRFDADDLVQDLSIGDRQMVEIARALIQDPSIIIFDEPTSSLTSREKRTLFGTINLLKGRGVVIVYVTHFLEEIFEVCDRVTVLRNGATVGAGWLKEFKPRDIVELMLGESQVSDRRDSEKVAVGRPVLSVRHLSNQSLQDVSFTLHAGEILGLWGLLGSGRTELLRVLTGLDPIVDGEVDLDEGAGLQRIAPHRLHQRVGFVTEDRRHEGLLPPFSVAKNLSLASLSSLLNSIGFIDRRREGQQAEELVDRLDIKVSSIRQRAGTLSGGNQQKVVFGRWLATEPSIFFLDEPTRGLDVGAKNDILDLIASLAKSGAAILLVSSEVEELLRVCSRYLVIASGRLVAELGDGSDRPELLAAVSEDVPDLDGLRS